MSKLGPSGGRIRTYDHLLGSCNKEGEPEQVRAPVGQLQKGQS
jgi:hypothetical protein